jgi:hypothetical protein
MDYFKACADEIGDDCSLEAGATGGSVRGAAR